MITKKHVEHCLAHQSAHENATFGGRIYTQVASARTKRGAQTIVAKVHSLGFRARMSPLWSLGYKKLLGYQIFAAPAPVYETRHFADGQCYRVVPGRTRKFVTMEKPGKEEKVFIGKNGSLMKGKSISTVGWAEKVNWDYLRSWVGLKFKSDNERIARGVRPDLRRGY